MGPEGNLFREEEKIFHKCAILGDLTVHLPIFLQFFSKNVWGQNILSIDSFPYIQSTFHSCSYAERIKNIFITCIFSGLTLKWKFQKQFFQKTKKAQPSNFTFIFLGKWTMTPQKMRLQKKVVLHFFRGQYLRSTFWPCKGHPFSKVKSSQFEELEINWKSVLELH